MESDPIDADAADAGHWLYPEPGLQRSGYASR